MLDEQSQDEVATVGRTTSIIVFALCSGVVAFGAYVLLLHEAQQPPANGMLTYLSIGLAGMLMVLSYSMPRFIVRSGRKQLAAGQPKHLGGETPGVQTDAGKLALLYQQTTIIGCALLEGAAFLALVAYMIERDPVTLIVGVVMLIGLAMHMPLGDRLPAWVETQLRTMEEEVTSQR